MELGQQLGKRHILSVMKDVPQEFLYLIPVAKFLFLKGEKGVEIGLFVFLVETLVFYPSSPSSRVRTSKA